MSRPQNFLRTFIPLAGMLIGLPLAATKARPLFVTARVSDIAITYVRPRRERPEHRIVATAVWPGVASTDTAIVLAGRWAKQLSLADAAVAWIPNEDRLLGSIAILELDENGGVIGRFSSLGVFAADGRARALSFRTDAPRRPALGTDRIAFLSDAATLRTAPLDASALRFPEVRVFAAPRPEVRRRPG